MKPSWAIVAKITKNDDPAIKNKVATQKNIQQCVKVCSVVVGASMHTALHPVHPKHKAEIS
jgi:hypothetical protein